MLPLAEIFYSFAIGGSVLPLDKTTLPFVFMGFELVLSHRCSIAENPEKIEAAHKRNTNKHGRLGRATGMETETETATGPPSERTG